MPLVFACIAPHGSIAIPEAKPKDRPTLANATTAGMQELGRRFSAAEPDVSIVLTPHNIHVEGAMAVIDAAAVSGDLVQWGSPISLRIPVDRELALSVRDAIRETGIPVVAVSYGAKDDSYWQMLMLEGALGHDGWRSELLSYEAPTYFGMLCAAYAQRAT